MAIQRTVSVVLLALSFLVALFLVSCKSESTSSPTAPGSAVVMGTVVSGDAETGGTGVALSGLTVRVIGSDHAAQTDAAGNFTLSGVASGERQLQFSRGDISATGTMSVAGGTTSAVLATITRRTTVTIGPRAPSVPPPFATQTAVALLTTTATPILTPAPGTPTPVPTGGRVEEIEGIVTANSGGTLTIFDQRLGTVVVIVNGTTTIRHGQTPIAVGDILVGMRVHVKGTLVSPGTYSAIEIIVQDENTKTVTPPTAVSTSTPTPTATGGAATNTPTTTNTPTATNTPTMTPTPTSTP
jgi:uncharacterized protein DUF5666